MSQTPILRCHNLRASSGETEILRGVHVQIGSGELHVIVGQNGSGKSTLLKSLAGIGGYSISADSCQFYGKNLLELSIFERARRGVFLSFQHPPAIPGLKLASLVKEAVSARPQTEVSSAEILRDLKHWTAKWNFDPTLYKTEVNHTLSGGQQKMSEMLQAAMLQPKLLLLDEIDSGLDMDSVKKVARAIMDLRGKNRAIIVVTHYRRIVDFLENVSAVHVMKNGQIAKSGGIEIFDEIEQNGYESIR